MTTRRKATPPPTDASEAIADAAPEVATSPPPTPPKPVPSTGLSLEQAVYASALGALLSRGTPITEAIALAKDYAKQAAEAF